MRRITLRLFVSLLTFVVGVSAHSVLRRQKKHDPPAPIQQPAERNTVNWFVQQAKAKGEREVIVPGMFSCPVEFRNPKTAIAEAASYGYVVVAQLIDKKSTVWSKHEIATWYKLKTVERLNDKKFPEGKLHESVPAELLPLQADEFLVAKNGGVVVVDGVKIVSRSPMIPDSPATQQYIMFLKPAAYTHPDPTGKTGKLTYGLQGVFTLNADGTVEAAVQEPYPLKTDMESRYKNSLDKLRAGLKRR